MKGLVLAGVLASCSSPHVPTCDEIDANVRRVTKRADDVTKQNASGSAALQYLPRFGDFAQGLDRACRAGKLDRVAKTCFAQARDGMDVDRCAAQHLPER
jgi:hypothetical protein